MPSAHDVAKYILSKRSPVTAMKLQKLVYYTQAWSLVWDESALFDERIEAWANGPVVPDLYTVHKGTFQVRVWPEGNAEVFSQKQIDTIDAVLEYYGKMPSHSLSDLTHAEEPWKQARIGVPDGARCNNEITLASMEEYYSGL